MLAIAARATQRQDWRRADRNWAVLSTSKLLEDRTAAAAHLPPLIGPERERLPDNYIVGLALVEPGCQWHGPLTLWSSEERLQWDFLGAATDAYSARVVRSAALVDPTPVVDNRMAARMRGHPHLQVLAAACLDGLLAQQFLVAASPAEPITGRELLTNWGVELDGAPVLSVGLPARIAQCAVRGLWPQVLLLGRWRCAHRLFQGWPAAALFAYGAGGHYTTVNTPLTDGDPAEHLTEIASRLQRWAPALLAQAPADESDELRRDMEASVVFLLRLRASLDLRSAAAAAEPPPPSGDGDDLSMPARCSFPALALITHLRHAGLLKNMTHLHQSINHAIETVVPPVLQAQARQALQLKGALPGRETLRIYRFLFDVAFSRWFAQCVPLAGPGSNRATGGLELGAQSPKPAAIYLWSDSSPQGKRIGR